MSSAYDADGNRDTVLNRARRFFRDNPDEMLTREDLQVKFDCGPDMAKMVARALIREGTARRDQLPRTPRASRSCAGAAPGAKTFPHNLTRGQVVTLEAYIRCGDLARAARVTGRNYHTMVDQMKDARRACGVRTTAELALMFVRACAAEPSAA